MLAAGRPIRNTRAVHFGASWRWSVSLISALLLIAVGIVACFFGKRLYRVVLALIGFVIGFHAAAELLGSQPDRARIAGAVLAGAAFYLLYKFACILFGLGMGLVLAESIATAIGLQDTPALILALVLAVAGAELGWRLADFILRLSTASASAWGRCAGGGARPQPAAAGRDEACHRGRDLDGGHRLAAGGWTAGRVRLRLPVAAGRAARREVAARVHSARMRLATLSCFENTGSTPARPLVLPAACSSR
jgi:hypothetical protein